MNYPPRWFEDAVFPGSVFAVCSVGAFVVLERIGMPEVFAVWFAFAAGMSATVAVLCAMDRTFSAGVKGDSRGGSSRVGVDSG